MKRAVVAPSLRSELVFAAILGQIRLMANRGVRVVHYSVQHDHVHLLVEAADKPALAKALQLLFSRMAFAVNRVCGRSGKLFRDRHHRRALKTPTETRNALVYVLFNGRKHDIERTRMLSDIELSLEWLDECSSAHWFLDWDPRARPPPETIARRLSKLGQSPPTPASCWLLTSGWKRAPKGLVRFDETPAIH